MEELEKIVFTTEDGDVECFILDETRINEKNYILVTDSKDPENDEEMEVMILKEESVDENGEATYDFIDDDKELEVVAKLFEESLGDIDIDLTEE